MGQPVGQLGLHPGGRCAQHGAQGLVGLAHQGQAAGAGRLQGHRPRTRDRPNTRPHKHRADAHDHPAAQPLAQGLDHRIAANYFALFSLPNNEQWFSADYGDLKIVALNDTVTGKPDAVPVDQVDFMRATLADSQSAWRIAYHHQATFSSSSAHGSNLYLRTTWEPLFDELGFDFVLAGHDHTYERTLPIRGGALADPAEGAYYFVAGGAGAPLYRGHDVEWFTARTADTHNYVIGVFTPDGVTWTARDLADNVIDELFVPRRRP